MLRQVEVMAAGLLRARFLQEAMTRAMVEVLVQILDVGVPRALLARNVGHTAKITNLLLWGEESLRNGNYSPLWHFPLDCPSVWRHAWSSRGTRQELLRRARLAEES